MLNSGGLRGDWRERSAPNGVQGGPRSRPGSSTPPRRLRLAAERPNLPRQPGRQHRDSPCQDGGRRLAARDSRLVLDGLRSDLTLRLAVRADQGGVRGAVSKLRLPFFPGCRFGVPVGLQLLRRKSALDFGLLGLLDGKEYDPEDHSSDDGYEDVRGCIHSSRSFDLHSLRQRVRPFISLYHIEPSPRQANHPRVWICAATRLTDGKTSEKGQEWQEAQSQSSIQAASLASMRITAAAT